jgi:hypothetical protein
MKLLITDCRVRRPRRTDIGEKPDVKGGVWK